MNEDNDVEGITELRLSFPECVLFRPKMYTVNGTFVEIAAFLIGFYSGLSKSSPRLPVIVEWGIFQGWLKAKLAEEFNVEIENFSAFHYIAYLYPEDEKAIEKLKALLKEFIDGQYALKALQKSYDSLVEDTLGKRSIEEMINKISEYPHKSSL